MSSKTIQKNDPVRGSGASLSVVPPANLRSLGEDEDDLLLRKFLEGSEIERSRLYDHIVPVCRATIRRMVGPSHRDTEDLLQSAIERIVGTLVSGSFSRRCSLRTWAVTITRNVVLSEIHAQSRERRYRADEDLETYPDEAALLCSVEQGELRAALLHLPKKMVLPLLLHDMLGYTAAEIAGDLGLTNAGVQSRIWRARALARRHLAGGAIAQTR